MGIVYFLSSAPDPETTKAKSDRRLRSTRKCEIRRAVERKSFLIEKRTENPDCTFFGSIPSEKHQKKKLQSVHFCVKSVAVSRKSTLSRERFVLQPGYCPQTILSRIRK